MNKPRCPNYNVRMLTLILWIPAIAFLIPYGVQSQQLAPTLGLIPMTLSALIAIMHITGQARWQPINILLDIFTACFLIGALIPGWVFIAEGRSRYWYYNKVEITMLGAYGTVPLMVNL